MKIVEKNEVNFVQEGKKGHKCAQETVHEGRKMPTLFMKVKKDQNL